VEGWHPVEDVVRWGFGQAPAVMANRDVPGPITALPDDPWGYLAQPEMRTMIGATKDMGEDNGDVWVPMSWNFRELTGEEPAEDELTGTLLPEDGA
jgi:hypothetical protein